MLLWQLLVTLLCCLICNLFQTVSANTNNVNQNNIDEVCSKLQIQYENTNIILQKHPSSVSNKPIWSLPTSNNINNNILVSYDEWTKSWEIMLPTTSNTPNIYRVESVTIIPPSTIYTNKFTQDKIYITTTCQSNTPTTQPSDLTYPRTAASCAEILSFFNYTIPDGIYEITILNKIYHVYCSFDPENEFAWTLVESFSEFYASTLYSLSFNLGINPKNPMERNLVYRLPIKQMKSIQSISTHNLVTCNFDLSLSHDYLLLDTTQTGWDILTKERTICRPVTELNIRGYQCNGGTAPFWTLSNHFHIDSSYDKCSCNQWIDTSIKNEDNFGQFRYFNRHHACSANNMSTTNYWIGSKVNFPSRYKPTCPEDIDGCSELNMCTSCDDTCEYCQNLNSSICGPLDCITCANTDEETFELWEINEDDGTGMCWNNSTFKSTCPSEKEECSPINQCTSCHNTCEYCQHPFKQICGAEDCITCTDEAYHLVSHHKYTYIPYGVHYENTGYCYHNSSFKPTCPAGVKGCTPDNQCSECDPSCGYCQSNAWGWLKFDVIMTCGAHECMTCVDESNKFVQLRADGTGYCINVTQPDIITTTPCPQCENCSQISTTMDHYVTMDTTNEATFDCSMCTIATEPCPTIELPFTTPEPCDCNGLTTSVPETTNDGITTTTKTSQAPCNNTETIYIYVNKSCPEPTPCPTMSMDYNTTQPTATPSVEPTELIITGDCEYCGEECGMIYPPNPSVSPTVQPIEPKVSANYSVRVELRVEYANVDDLCPTDESFGDYLLELSTCQVLDMESIYCEIISIRTIQTVPSINHVEEVSNVQRRRLIHNDVIIYIGMDISADTADYFDYIEGQLNDSTFAGRVNKKWQSNSKNIGEITQILTADDIITPSPITIETKTPSTGPIGDDLTNVPINVNEAVTKGTLDAPAAIGMVVGIGIVLVFCYCFVTFFRNRNKNKSAQEDNALSEGMTDAETNEDNDIEHSHSNISQLPQPNSVSNNNNRLVRIDNNGDEVEHDVLVNMNADDEKQVEINENVNNYIDGIGGNGLNNENENSFDSVLRMNGAAYFEDSDIRKQQALPMPMTATGHPPQQYIPNRTQFFEKQSGPVISQQQKSKYEDLKDQQEFLSALEAQLHELEQQSAIASPSGMDKNQEPGGSVDRLKSELIQLNIGIKAILDKLGYDLPASVFDDDIEYDEIDVCVQYSRFLNAILKKYGDVISNLKLDDEMDIQELEEKRQKYQQMTKRSSKKVSKLYAMSKSGGKQKNNHSNSSSSRSHSHHKRHDSDTSEMSGMSDAQIQLDKTNDNDIMSDFVIKPMKRNSKSYQNEQNKLLQNMPSSPSVSGVSNLSNIQTPIIQPDILNLVSNNKKRGSRNGAELNYNRNETDDDEYEIKDVEDPITRHNDPTPSHATHKRDGYVDESTRRMDNTGGLPTPSKSDTARQFEDSDLKQNMEIINEQVQYQQQGLPQPIYNDNDLDYDARNRGISNVSGSTSNSDVGSLNSADSSDIIPIKNVRNKNVIPPSVITETGAGYNANEPFEPSTTNSQTGTSITVTGSGSNSNSSGSNVSTDTDVNSKGSDGKKKKKKKKPKRKKSKKSKFDTSFLGGDDKKHKYRGKGTGVTPAKVKTKKDSPKSKKDKKKSGKKSKSKKKDR